MTLIGTPRYIIAMTNEMLPDLDLDMLVQSGMFGDFGTLLPLLLAMANVGSVAPAAALFWFGAFNVATAYEWDVPMCVQPMKTIAAAVSAATGALRTATRRAATRRG